VRFASGTLARNPLAPVSERVLARQQGICVFASWSITLSRSSTNAVRIADTSTHQSLTISSDLSRSNVPFRLAGQICKELPVRVRAARSSSHLLDSDSVDGCASYEVLHALGRPPQCNAQPLGVVRRSFRCRLGSGFAETSIMGGSASTHAARRKTVQGQPSVRSAPAVRESCPNRSTD